MSSIMNDVDKVQLATSQILADFLRQLFAAVALLFVVLSNDWKLAVVSLTVLPSVMLPTTRNRPRASGAPAGSTQDAAGGAEPDPAGDPERPHGGEGLRRRGYESRRFREAARQLLKTNLRYVLQQALSSPLIEMFGGAHHRGLADLRADPDQEPAR